MNISLIGYADHYSGVGQLLMQLRNDGGIIETFIKKEYGTSLKEVCIVFVCNEGIVIETKPRIRLSKKELILYMDIILSYEEMMEADQDTRKKIMATRLLSDTAKVIAKYKFKDFDLPRFLHDLETELKRIGFW